MGLTSLGIENNHYYTSIQQPYCEKVIKKFHLSEAKPMATPISNRFKLSVANSSKDLHWV